VARWLRGRLQQRIKAREGCSARQQQAAAAAARIGGHIRGLGAKELAGGAHARSQPAARAAG